MVTSAEVVDVVGVVVVGVVLVTFVVLVFVCDVFVAVVEVGVDGSHRRLHTNFFLVLSRS